MATITPENVENKEEKPPIVKPPKELRADLPALPCKKGATIPPEIGFSWLDRIKEPELLKRITVYVYRIRPKIIKEPPAYIHKYPDWSMWSQNEFIATHGGGTYKFAVNEMGGEHSLFHIKYEIDMTTYEPIINLKELDLGSIENKAWIDSQKTKGRIKQTTKGLVWTSDDDGRNMSRGNEETPGELIGSITSVFKEFAQMNQQKTDPVLTALLSKLANDDSGFKAKDLAPILATVMPLVTKMLEPKPQDDTLIKLLMAQAETARQDAQAARESTNKLIEKMMDTKPTDPFAMVAKVKEVEALFTKDQPEEKPRDKFDKFIDMFAALAPTLLTGFMGMPKPGMPSATPQAAMPHYPSVVAPQLAKPSQVDPNELLMQFNDPSVSAIIANSINDEVPGWEFGYKLEDLAGKDVHTRICQFDKSIILACLNQSTIKPQLKNSVDMQRLDKFLEEFINYEQWNPETGTRSMVQ